MSQQILRLIFVCGRFLREYSWDQHLGKGRAGKGRDGKGREGKARKGKGREGEKTRIGQRKLGNLKDILN